MAPENTQNSNIQLTSNEILKLENAFKNAEFRQLLVEYSKEINDPENRRRYEAEIKQLELETSGTDCTFLHPQPGYVIKTWGTVNQNNNEKIFINVCSDENVAKPESKRAVEANGGRKGLQWSIPYSLTKARRDMDKAGLSCLVYDIIFHPNALALAERSAAIRGLLNDTALEAVEKNGDQVKLDKKKVRFPKMKFKGSFHPTVIRKATDGKPEAVKPEPEPVDVKVSTLGNNPTPDPPADVGSGVREPKYSVKYRHTSDIQDAAVFQGGRQFIRDPTRPSEILVEVYLPEMSSAKTVELDVEEKKMTLESTEPAKYRLVVNFAYPVDEEKGAAKFDRSTHKLLVTLPVKDVVVSVNRLTSTDSGIDIEFEDDSQLIDVVKEDTAYRTSDECDNESDNGNDVKADDDDSEDVVEDVTSKSEKKLLFPTYTCNVYDELMVLKLDVKNVDEESLVKTNLVDDDGSGFSIRFTTIGSGMVPLNYGFDMIFKFKDDEPGYCLDDIEVEIWDNNIIVQMALPMADCSSYKVGNCAENMKEHGLPQLRAFKQKRKQLMRTMSAPEKRFHFPEPASSHTNMEEKERHSSGDSAISSNDENSASATNVSANDATPKSAAGDILPVRGILKTSLNRPRCFSESDQSMLMTSPSLSSCISIDSSIPEEDESAFAADNGSVKKSVRFSEVVHRQVFRSNSSILGQKMKNVKKAEQKKRRALERRASEGDVDSLAADKPGSWTEASKKTCPSVAPQTTDDEDSHTDSGLASSVEEPALLQMSKRVQQSTKKSTKQTKKKTSGGNFLKEANSDLIFDLDF